MTCGARSVTVLAYLLLRRVRFETISQVAAKATTKITIVFDEDSAA